MMTMKTVSARQANHQFSDLLSRVERGEEILITKRNKPVAVLSPYRPPSNRRHPKDDRCLACCTPNTSGRRRRSCGGALEAVRAHRLSFWDAMLWALAQRAGVRCLLTED